MKITKVTVSRSLLLVTKQFENTRFEYTLEAEVGPSESHSKVVQKLKGEINELLLADVVSLRGSKLPTKESQEDRFRKEFDL